MAYKAFIDGEAGTTGLRLASRLEAREDIELIRIEPARRKELSARVLMALEADVTFLCLPDEGARELVRAAGAGKCRIIDCSTAHRTEDGWVYGLPELGDAGASADTETARTANPGCHATGFILAVRPLIDAGIIAPDAPLCVHSLTGYSGGGKSMIAEYEAARGGGALAAPRQYALGQGHKHLPEMMKHARVLTPPVFSPVVCDFYCGMLAGVPLPRGVLRKGVSLADVRETLAAFYEGRPLIKVREIGAEYEDGAGAGFLTADALAGRDDLELFVTGNADCVQIIARYDNLGKGASGAAIQNMNRMLGLREDAGLTLGG